MPANLHTAAFDAYVPPLQRRLMGVGAPHSRIAGTAVFADISGFTRLSERLARAGTEGAERLVDLIDSCFSALLDEAAAVGGSLLKFGGDALLVWFEGDEHEARACAAALGMRATLRRVGQVRAGGTPVALRMSVGVHSGEYDFFLVGDSHRELLVAGPAATRVVAMEAAASAGQVLLSTRTAALVPRRCLGVQVGLGSLLLRAPSVADYTQPPPVLADGVESCFCSLLRRYVLGHQIAPEHRSATVSFVQFGGLDGVIEQDGPPAAVAALEELVGSVQRAAARYEVCFLASDIAPDGGKLLLSAGAPLALGDDEERMLLALREVVESDVRLPFSAGVNRGHVFAAEVGPPYRRTYAAMGDAVNVAARLAAKAPAGHIYTTGPVLGRLRTGFAVRALEPMALKGKREPLAVFDVGARSAVTALRSARRRPPLVGRAAELAAIEAGLESARQRRGSLIELVGETGSGKSRLLTEARRRAEGLRVLHASCEAYTRDTPYAGASQVYRQLLGLQARDSDETVLDRVRSEVQARKPELMPWMPLIAMAFGVSIPFTAEIEELAPDARAGKVAWAITAFLGRELGAPTLLVVEHAHMMDAASGGLLTLVAQAAETTAWLILLTRRDTAGGFEFAGPHTRLELAPLSYEQSMTLAQATPEAERIPPHVLELAVRRAGGSPEFLLDLLAAAAEGDRDALPASVSAAAAARLDALDPLDRRLIRRVAVLGLVFEPDRVPDVLGDELPAPDEEKWRHLAPILARDPDGRLRFKRPALQEAAYHGLPFKLRRELHATVARALESASGGADPAVLSQHWLAAGEPERGYHCAMLAAERARRQFSHADAVAHYRRAIEAARAAGPRAEASVSERLAHVWEELGDALRCVGEPDAAIHALTHARRLAPDDPIAQARLCHRHAEVVQRARSLPSAVRWVRRGLREIAEREDDEAIAWRARLDAYLAGMRARQGRWREAERACRSAIAAAEGIGERRSLAFACYVLDWALVELGRPGEAGFSRRALEIYRELGDREHESTVLNNLGMFAHFEGRWEEAVALYTEAAECSQRAGRPADAAYTDCNVGEILSDQGHYEQARVHLERARRMWRATGDAQTMAFVDAVLGRLALREGDVEEARSQLARAAAEMHAYGMSEAEFAVAVLAEVEAMAGDPRRALTMAEVAIPDAGRWLPVLQRAAGIASMRLGRLSAAEAALRSAIATARRQRAFYDTAAAIDVLVHIGRADATLAAERAEIIERLRISALPALPLAGGLRVAC